MNKIASFQVDHTKFGIGMYTSRIDGDIVTYDIRMVKPNGGTYISCPSMHTIEHLFATFARNSSLSDKVIYVGPMGCRTGFYLVVRGMSQQDAINLTKDSMAFIRNFEGQIPGSSETECGNYKDHDLKSAKEDVLNILTKLDGYAPNMLNYNWHIEQK